MFAIFPASSLDNSILTSVLVGLLVVWALQETLGWNFTGLVVPGYLASIFIIQPVAGVVVVVEALLCWGVFLAISERVPAWWPWTPLFGRDRFFLFLLLSVLVRLLLEAGGFDFLSESLGLAVSEDLHSMGLVVVPLAANALWRSGTTRSLARFGLPVALTWAILTYALLPHTNLSLSSFELTYEDLALDFVSSPRAYILLLIGAWLGSAANQRWGWDYGGIIVPGLLALCWAQPHRVLATLGEAVVIAGMYLGVTRLPGFRTANLTGGRPLVLAFCLGYAARFALAWGLGGRWPGFAVRDLFGFGFLLSTIVALRIVKHKDVFRSVIPALTVSLSAWLVGAGLSYGLAVALPGTRPEREPASLDPSEMRERFLHAAWKDQGSPPVRLDELLRQGRASLVTGGEGFGALWVRVAGAPLAVIGALDAPGSGPAALAVGDALGARAILLCKDGASSACRAAGRQLSRRLTVLRIKDGPRATLAVAGQLPQALDPGALGRLLGAFELEQGAGEATLALDDATRMRTAAAALGVEPAGDLDPLGLPAEEGALLSPPDRADRRRFLADVARPILGWWAGAPGNEDALRVAAGSAEALGLRLAHAGESVTLVGPGWSARLARGAGSAIVYVPDARADVEGLDVARALTLALPASVSVVDAPNASAESGATRDRLPTILLLAAIDTLGPEAEVITVRSVPRTRDPGAEIVLTTGHAPGADPGEPARRVRALFEAAGSTVILQDGAAQRMSLSDSGNPAAMAVSLETGAPRSVAVFAGPRAAQRYRSPDALEPARVAVERARLPRRDLPLSELAGWVTGEAGPDEAPTLAALESFLRTGRAAALNPVRSGREAAEISLLCDPELGCRWLAVERCAEERCEGLVLPLDRGAARARAALAPEARPALEPAAALAFGAADLRTRRPRVQP